MRAWGYQSWGASVWGGTGIAETITDYFDGEAWDRPDALDDPTAGGGFGGDGDTITLPVGDPDGDPVTITLNASKVRPFPIEVYDEDGAKLAAVGVSTGGSSGFLSGTYKATLAEAGECIITLAQDDPAVEYFEYPNRVWVRDRFGLVLGRFVVRRVRKYRQGDARFVEVHLRDVLIQAAREPVIEYIATDTIGNHIAALFADQVQALPFGVGRIDAAIRDYEVSLELTATNLLNALNAMREQLPAGRQGHFYINRQNEFCWRERIGPVGRKFQIGRNLRGVSVSTNDDDLVTRLYMYGEGQDGTDRLSLVDAGEANPYLESNVETYGIVPMVKIDRRILKPETLLANAQRILDEFDTPQVEVDVNVLDLSQADAPTGQDWSEWGDYYVGSKYTVRDAQQGIDTEVTVSEIEYNLANPLPVRVLSSRRRRGLQDVFREMDQRIPGPVNVNRTDRYSNIARIYESGDDRADSHRDGDLRRGAENLGYYRDGSFVDLVPSYTAATEGALPSDVPANAIGRVETDPQDTYVRNTANDGWEKLSAGGPLAVRTEASGRSTDGHWHQGMPWVTVTNYADLPASDPGVIGYVTSERAWYGKTLAADGVTGVWWPILVAVPVNALPSVPTVGARAVVYDGQVYLGTAGNAEWTRAQYVDDIT